MELKKYRDEIDGIDKELTELFCRRMEAAKNIAAYKKENGMAVYDAGREAELLEKIEKAAGEEMGDHARRLYASILNISRAYQNSFLVPDASVTEKIKEAVEKTPPLFPEKASVACQGIEGAHSSKAARKLFEKATLMYCQTFEGVFQAVQNGLCHYGVVPLENSSAGSVNQIYSLMSKYNFSIVRSIKMHIKHSLLANKGATIEGIKEIYSHPQAISQSSEFIATLKGVKVIPCENTAVAAKLVSESGRDDIAALASIDCAQMYSLEVLKKSAQDTENNYTRFICFSKNLEIYPGADRTSLLIKTPHRAGELYSVISNFYSVGVNILKLESRPIPETDFEFMFYFDIDVSIYSEKLPAIINTLVNSLGKGNVKYLGSYREV